MEIEKIAALLKQGEILEVEDLLKTMEENKKSKEIIILERLIDIFRSEVSNDIERTVFDYSTDIYELAAHFTKVKLMLRRVEFDMPLEYIDEFYRYCEDTGVSFNMLSLLVMANITPQHRKKVCSGLAGMYERNKGEGYWEVRSFTYLANHMGG
jgi:hypothetical protein